MPKKTSTTKPTPNTPAPGLPETAADVSATVAAPAATPAAASTVVEGEQSSSGDQALSPLGEGVIAGDETPEHTPAPGLPETAAEVLSATVAAPAATQAAAPPAVEGEQLPSEDKALPPAGEGVTAGDDVTGDGTGDLLPPLGVVAVIVTSEVEGFRRAGRAWSRTPTTVLIEDLSDADLLALEAEPLLQVAYVTDNAEKAA